MNSEVPEEVCDVSYELVIKMGSAVQVMSLKVTLEIRQYLPPFQNTKEQMYQFYDIKSQSWSSQQVK